MPAYSQELQDVYLGWCLASRQETCLQEIWPSSLRHQVPRFFQIVITCWIWMWFPPHGVHRYFSPSLCPTWVSRIYPLSCLLRQVSQDDDQSHQNRTATALPLPFAPVLPHLVLAASFHINLDIPVTISYSCRDIWKEGRCRDERQEALCICPWLFDKGQQKKDIINKWPVPQPSS